MNRVPEGLLSARLVCVKTSILWDDGGLVTNRTRHDWNPVRVLAVRPRAPMRTYVIVGHGRSFDHFVGSRQDRWRHGKTERPRGSQIDDQLEFRWLLHRQIGRFGAAADLARINTELVTNSGLT